MDTELESGAHRAARLKKSHDAYVIANPQKYPGTHRGGSSRSRRSASGPGWAQSLVNTLGRVDVRLAGLSDRFEQLEARILRVLDFQESDGAPSVLGEGTSRRLRAALEADSFEAPLFFGAGLGGSSDDYA